MLHRPEQLDAVQARHHDVGKDQVEGLANGQVDGLVGALRAADKIARAGQACGSRIDDRAFIVDQQDPFLRTIGQEVPPSPRQEAATP